MQYTAEEVKGYLKNYHVYSGKVACGTTNGQTVQAIERLQVALDNLRYSEYDLIRVYYISKGGSLSDIAKDCRCSKNNIAKKLNRIIGKLAQMMSDGEQIEIHSANDAVIKYTESQVRKYLKYLKQENDRNRRSHQVKDSDYLRDKNLFIRAIHALDDMDQQIVLESYLYGETLSVIGNTYGYSVSGVKYRINVAIKKICAMMNGDV
ncbi:MAG: hypothetical protein NC131_11440 [Roseburia sp.]|nr:hypothetical protein [Roseburia sp.]